MLFFVCDHDHAKVTTGSGTELPAALQPTLSISSTIHQFFVYIMENSPPCDTSQEIIKRLAEAVIETRGAMEKEFSIRKELLEDIAEMLGAKEKRLGIMKEMLDSIHDQLDAWERASRLNSSIVKASIIKGRSAQGANNKRRRAIGRLETVQVSVFLPKTFTISCMYEGDFKILIYFCGEDWYSL